MTENFPSALRMLLLLCGTAFATNAWAQPSGDLPRVFVTEVAVIPQTNNQHPIRIALNPSSGELFVLVSRGLIYRLAPNSDGTFSPEEVSNQSQHGTPNPVGMAFAQNGGLYLLGNENVGSARSRFILRRGEPSGSSWTWSTVATSEGYLLSHTWFDHKANGLALSPDEQTLYINSGARTDHGEQYGGVREEGLTSIVLRVPANAQDIILPNDRQALKDGGFVFAEGIRNSFDLEFAPNGDLLAADNAGDRDDSEEFNWIREGHHYGFPWRIGTSETPQQHAGYDPAADPFVQPDRNTNNQSDNGWYFGNDPTYPAPPAGIVFTDPIPNRGPFADRYRAPQSGEVLQASAENSTLGSFTPHRSPLGLVFDADSVLSGPRKGGAFLVNWNSSNDQLLSRLGGTGEDLLHLDLDKSSGEYTMSVERVAHGFDHPIDAAIVGGTIYVLEYGPPSGNGGSRSVQAVSLPGSSPLVSEPPSEFPGLTLDLYPNPVSGDLRIAFSSSLSNPGILEIVDMLGRVVTSAEAPGGDGLEVSTRGLAPGVYLARLRSGDIRATRVFTVAR